MRSDSALDLEQNEPRLLDVAESEGEIPEISEDGVGFVDEVTQPAILRRQFTPEAVVDRAPSPLPDSPIRSPAPHGLRRWLSTLRRRKQHQPPTVTPHTQRWTLDDFEKSPVSPAKQRYSRHKQSNSNGSSFAFVSAVKSATATIASVSAATVSRRNSRWRGEQQRSSVVSCSEPRPSVESQRSIMDEAAKQRSRKRREKLEELIRTEESYVADVKALSNVGIPEASFRA